MTLRRLPLMLQAALGDGVAFDPFSLQQDDVSASEVDVGRGSQTKRNLAADATLFSLSKHRA
jgi:hypothetical protein